MTEVPEHHVKGEVCLTRLVYRAPNTPNGVKAYTVSQESCYLLIQHVPALNLSEELARLISNSGTLISFEKVDGFPSEEFRDAFLAKYTTLASARYVKKTFDDRPFYGSNLHISYAPEKETVDETRVKLESYRKYVAHFRYSQTGVTETMKRPQMKGRDSLREPSFTEIATLTASSDDPNIFPRTPITPPSFQTGVASTTLTKECSRPAESPTNSVEESATSSSMIPKSPRISSANPPTQHFSGVVTPFFPVPRQVKIRQGFRGQERCQNLLISQDLLKDTPNPQELPIVSQGGEDSKKTVEPNLKKPKKRRRI